MATSGTVGRTVIDVTSIIEHAVRRCGVLTSAISGEQQQSARENLFLILSNFATKGLSLWCVDTILFGLLAGRAQYDMPLGTVDILNMQLRYNGTFAAGVAGVGAATYTPTSATLIQSALITPAVTGDYQLVLEASDDGVTWDAVGAQPRVSTFRNQTPLGVIATTARAAAFWRVRDTVNPARTLAAARFTFGATDVPMSKLSRDDYASLPNKLFTSTAPLQFWYNKQAEYPQVTLWPAPQIADAAVLAYTQRQVQDVGALSNTLDVPQRWLDAVIAELATRVYLELPAGLVVADRYLILEGRAEAALLAAQNSESDGAPVRIAPNIGCYTR